MNIDDPLFAGALSVCQLMLSGPAAEGTGALTSETISAKVDEVLSIPTYSGVDRERLIAALEHRFTIYTAPHTTLGADDDHVLWLPSRRGTLQWRYWNRYKLYLEPFLPNSAIESIDRVSDDVLGRLEDPERDGPWDRRGLVVGNVQAGKTANYCGLVCKAADSGYKVIIVLAGIHNSLRSQTQIRMDDGFLGFMSEPRLAAGQQAFRPTGVAFVDNEIRANTGTNRTENGDFSKRVADQFGINPGGLPLLFVVKKNVRVLDNILAWLRGWADGLDQGGRKFVRRVPVLVIDDEADLASVDTRAQSFDEQGNPDPDHNPARTNELIRRILRSFEKIAYVGYTATPFANIYIHDKGWTQELGDDLFPRSFIVNLPAGTNYIGPSRVFGISSGEDAASEDMSPLPLVRALTDHANSDVFDEEQGWMPPKLINKTGHVPLFEGEQRVPPSLRRAILSFILATTVRKIRRDEGPKHNSMLVHVVRYTNVQRLVGQQVETELKEIVQRLQYGDGERRPRIVDELEDLWTTDFVPTNAECARLTSSAESPSLPLWSEVTANLHEVASTISVKLINGSAKDALDYEANKATGINIIVIGGDKLSRGLTLEGLTVSYFLRASRMYDTLMQMGRWFGYRDGYLDVCRLFTTAELVGWFAHITAANEELQREFDHMVSVGGTPKDYGLKVRSHPLLLVTSRVKMRNGTEIRLSYSGDISETIIFSRDTVWINRNFTAADNWLSLLGRPASGSRNGGYQWNKVPVDQILQFLAAYTSHEDAARADTALLSKYIIAQREQTEPELTEWTVLLVSSGDSDARPSLLAGLSIGLTKRAPYLAQPADRYRIKQLVSPPNELVDLTDDQVRSAIEQTVANWANNPDPRKRADRPTSPGRREAREVRPKNKGLMLLYPLDPVRAEIDGATRPIIGLAISFPKSDTAREVTYIVDNIFLRRGGDDESL